MGKPAAIYKTDLQFTSTPPPWTTFYDKLRTTYAILMKVCLSAQKLVTSILKLKCPLSGPLSMHYRLIF